MSRLLKTKAIIFDIRNYPQNVYSKISSYLNRERKAFARMEVPQKGFPGVYVREKTLFVGRTNENYYRGKVILLIDANTQSMAELTVMALLTAPNVTSIGSHTAGTNGDVMSIPLPGAYQTAMSSVGVYFPDGRQTQRVGIKPDIFVRPTVKGIRGKRDEVFERAIHYINTGKH
jgi:C-terminal processing protease CtpA/Prc